MNVHPPKQKKLPTKIAGSTHEQISRLAYELYERDGKIDGQDLNHWFNAESMMESQFGYGSDHTEHDFTKTKGDE